MSNLHDTVYAEVQARLEMAKKAETANVSGRWEVESTNTPSEVQTMITFWSRATSPADSIRRYERDLKVLERHYPTTMGGAPLSNNDECGCAGFWPCDEITDLAESLGIQP